MSEASSPSAGPPLPPAGYRMRAEVRAHVRFLTTAEGGRNGPVITPWLRCPLLLGNEYFDCCLQPTSPDPIPLGVTTEVFLQFTRPDLVLPLLSVGLTFTLREVRPTGHGVVLELLHPEEPLVSSIVS